VTSSEKKITLGEMRAIERELEAFAGKPKKRGCPICRNEDQALVQVARDKGYTAQKVADFLITIRNYDKGMDESAVYRHWYRCKKEVVEE